MRRLASLLILSLLAGCGTPVASRPTPQPIIDITPAATQDIDVTVTALAEQLIPTEQPQGSYVVRDGDTLESIAIAFNTTVEEISATNRISDANIIFVGQTLIIPSLISSTDTLSPSLNLDQPKVLTPTP